MLTERREPRYRPWAAGGLIMTAKWRPRLFIVNEKGQMKGQFDAGGSAGEGAREEDGLGKIMTL